MKTTVTVSDFRDAFRTYGREDAFSYKGLGALFEYLEELEKDLRGEMELDVVSICCDYAEYSSALEAAQELISNYEPDGDDEEEIEEQALAALQEETTVIEFEGGEVVQSF